MLYQVFFILAAAYQISCATYYVESAPVAPFSCTAVHPCRVADLPGAFTVSDTIIYVPATTGVSSTFSFGAKIYTNPAIVISPGVTFSGCTLTVRSSPLINCTDASLIATSFLKTLTVDTILSTNCNYTASQFSSISSSTINFLGGVISGMSSAQHFIFAAASVTVDGMTVKSSTSSQAIFTFGTTIGSESTYIARNLIFDTVTTTGGFSTIVFQSNSGTAFDLTVSEIAFTSVTSDAAYLEFQVNPVAGGGTFYQEVDVIAFTATGGSCKKGIMYANNNDESAQMTANIALSSATGVNFHNAAAFVLNANTGIVTFNANDLNNNNICSPTNQPNLAECHGTVANTAFLFSGNDEGGLTTNNCPVRYVTGSTTC